MLEQHGFFSTFQGPYISLVVDGGSHSLDIGVMVVDIHVGHHRESHRYWIQYGQMLKLRQCPWRGHDTVIMRNEAICWRSRPYQCDGSFRWCRISLQWRQDSSTRLCEDGAGCLDGARVFGVRIWPVILKGVCGGQLVGLSGGNRRLVDESHCKTSAYLDSDLWSDSSVLTPPWRSNPSLLA